MARGAFELVVEVKKPELEAARLPSCGQRIWLQHDQQWRSVPVVGHGVCVVLNGEPHFVDVNNHEWTLDRPKHVEQRPTP